MKGAQLTTRVAAGMAAGSALFLVGTHLACAATVSVAPGATLTSSYTTTSAGTSPAGGTGTIYAPTVPGSYNYSQGFGAGQGTTAVPGGTDGFYVDYVFTVGGATADSLTATLDLGSLLQISNLSSRIYSYDLNPSTATSPTQLGTPVGGAIVSWTTPVTGTGASGLYTMISNQTLNPGTYVLQIRGTVTGSAGGSFAGVLNLAPVPLPAAAWLLVSGLGGLFATGRRRGAGRGTPALA
jgi:hypothetical protein